MQNKYDRCPNCMQELSQGEDICPYCGFNVAEYETKSICLKPFTVLQNKYMLGRVIGIGGFGITYIGWDLNLQTYIAIKEYYPDSFASRDSSESHTQVLPNMNKKDIYDKGLKRYVEEAQNLSKFYQLQGIVSVKDFFYENGTGYIVMEYINGINLKEYLNNAGGRLPEQTVLSLMKPVLESLYQIHNAGLVHRDISPDNIMVDSDGKIKLIDFGSARGQSAETDKTYTVILKHGYAPAEQYYAKGHQGPWTDIYSLCATMYKMLTGQIPPNSVERMENDEYISPTQCGVPVSPRTEAVLQRGLAVKANERYQNIGQLLADLYGTAPMALTSSTPMSQAAPIPTMASGGGQFQTSGVANQSMHLNMQPQQQAQPKKSNKGLIIGIIAGVAVLLIVGLVLLFGGGDDDDNKDDKKTTEEISTEAPDEPGDPTTTENVSTEATEPSSEPVAGNYTFEWPTEISSDWRDYTISIDGTIYKFPMPYSEFASKGWNCNNLMTSMPAGTYDYANFYNDSMEMEVGLVNYSLNEAPINECFVVGVSIDPDWNEIDDDVIIELAGNVRWRVSTEDDIKKAFGAPEYRYEGENYSDGSPYVSLDYAGDEYEDGMDLEINADGVLDVISIANTAAPEGIEANASDISTTPPEINSYYTAPAGPSTDRFDSIISINGELYQLPATVSAFTANGWALDTATDEYISGDSLETTYLEKEGNKIEVTLKNYTSDAMLPINAYIVSVRVEEEYCSYETVFPGGIKMGEDHNTFRDMYSDLGDSYYYDEYSTFVSQYAYYYPDDSWDSYTAHCYSDPETGLIDMLEYEASVREIKKK